MKLSIHDTIRGKPPKDTPINLGYGWTTIEADWADVFELITIDGVATSAALSTDNRREANFISRQLLMVDIDDSMTIAELLTNSFYNEFGAGFYTTPSFTPELHKFRICFILEQAESDSVRLRKINRGLLKVFAAGDDACKDPTRLFYGSPDCVLCERTDKVLANWVVDQLISVVDAEDAAREEAYAATSRDYAPVDDKQKARILELLKSTFVGSYPVWRNVGWGLKNAGFALADFQYVTAGMMREKSAEEAAAVWADGGTGCTLGTVIHLLKEKHGQDCLKDTRTTRQVGKLYKTAADAAQKWLKD